MTGKIIGWVVIVVLVVWGVVSLVNREEPTGEGPIKIGFVGPLSGDAAVYGESERDAVALAIEKVNADGGIDGRTLELIAEDGLCNGKDAANAMQKLVNVDGVKFVIGGFCSSESLAIVPIGEKNGVLMFSPGSSSPDLTGISDLFVRNYPSDATQGQILAELANSKGWTNVAFLQEQTDYALGVRNALQKALKH